MTEIEKAFDLVKVAEMLGIKARTVRQWIISGKIKAKKISGGRKWVVMESEIKRLQRGE